MKTAGKTVLITGGTGSLGRAIAALPQIRRFTEVRILSRDSSKQMQMQQQYPGFNYITGDISDNATLKKAVEDCDAIIHTAAMKDIKGCEDDPLKAMEINVTASLNLIRFAIEANAQRIIMVSTDKAVFPSSVMGMTKAFMEKSSLKMMEQYKKEATGHNTTLSVVRLGNLIGSAGTVLPLFTRQASEGKKLTVTDPSMTRFLMTPEDAAQYIMFVLLSTNSNSLVIKRAPAYSIGALAKSVLELYSPLYSKKPEEGIVVTGARPGEKRSETMASAQEVQSAIYLNDNHFLITQESNSKASKAFESDHLYCREGFHSENAATVNTDELKTIIEQFSNNIQTTE